MIVLTLPVPPLLNRYYRKFRNRMVLSSDGRIFKQKVALACREAGVTPLTGCVQVEAIIYRARNAGDVDGYAKAILDALQKHAYLDDKQVVKLTLIKLIDRRNPRAEVRITRYE